MIKGISIIRVLCIVGIILLIPLFFTIRGGGVEGAGWHWEPLDFLLVGIFLTIIGLLIEYTIQRFKTTFTRILIIGAILLASFALRVEVATGVVSRTIEALIG